VTTFTVAGGTVTFVAVALIVDVPAATPVTGMLTVVVPCAMVTVAGTVAAAVFEELTLKVRPPVGALADSVRVRFWVAVPTMVVGVGVIVAVRAAFTFTVAGVTVTLAAVAPMVVVPPPTPVTGMLTVVVPCAMVTVAGTVATPVLEELTLKVTPPVGALAERVRVRFWVAVPVMVVGVGVIVAVAVTFTVPVPCAKPLAVAVIMVDPSPMPVTCGWVAGVVAPAGIDTLRVEGVALVASVITRVTVVPPAGA